MNILPMHAEEAKRRHWVVRTLRYFGYLQVIGVTLAGLGYGATLLEPFLYRAFNLSIDTAHFLALVLGGLFGFLAGMLSSLLLWALALVIDDLHALRLYASGYVTMSGAVNPATGEDSNRPGRFYGQG